MKAWAKRLLARAGYEVRRVRAPSYPPDLTPAEIEDIEACRPYTKTSLERMVALCRAVEHVHREDVPGAIVECGVWKGGSMMLAARTLRRLGGARDLYLYDTFEGMTPPGEADVTHYGRRALDHVAREVHRTRADVHHVVTNLLATGYPAERLRFVKGRVEETLPARRPDRIALLRLDTDWYESTRHELEHLYPRLAPGGILLVDDYGHWRGARRAVDEYLGRIGAPLFLSRIDYTARIAVKPPNG